MEYFLSAHVYHPRHKHSHWLQKKRNRSLGRQPAAHRTKQIIEAVAIDHVDVLERRTNVAQPRWELPRRPAAPGNILNRNAVELRQIRPLWPLRVESQDKDTMSSLLKT